MSRRQSIWIPVLLLITLLGLISMIIFFPSQNIFEPKPTIRLFSINELLLKKENTPFNEIIDPYFPSGDNLCTTNCIAIGFRMREISSPGALATQLIYQYNSINIAESVFNNVLLQEVIAYTDQKDWNYQSTLAKKTFFGCGLMAGNVDQFCIWAGLYDEYIVVFRSRIIQNVLDTEDIEHIVKIIDTKMVNNFN